MHTLKIALIVSLSTFVLTACSASFSPVATRGTDSAEYRPTQEGPDDFVTTSPKKPWGEFTQVEDNGGHPWWADVLLWVPNRFLDFVDIFRVDIGVGPAFGAVVRVTEFGQLGYRQMAPFSLRIGDFGRRFPAMVESGNEIGAGPAFISSADRDVCTGEIGAGADLFIIGGYGGICVEEFADFLTGLFFIDIMDDDL